MHGPGHHHPLQLPSSPVPEQGWAGLSGSSEGSWRAQKGGDERWRAAFVWWKMDLQRICLLSFGNIHWNCLTAPGVMKPELIQNHILQSQFVQQHDNQKDWSSGEVFVFLAAVTCRQAEFSSWSPSGCSLWLWSPANIQACLPNHCSLAVGHGCVCLLYMNVCVRIFLKRLEIQHLNLSPLLQRVLLASQTDSSCVYICPCVYMALCECLCECECAGEPPEHSPLQIPRGLQHISKCWQNVALISYCWE